MKFRKVAMTAACVVMGGLLLAGCQTSGGVGASGGSGSGASGKATGVASGAAVNAQSTNTGSAATTGSGAGDGATTGQSGSGGSGSSGNSGGDSGSDSGSGYGICQVGELKISLDGENSVSSQVIEWVQLTNTGSAPCTMDGFAGVNLVGSASGQSNYTWPLTRDSEAYSEITVKSGESAYFGIKYLPWASGDGAEISVANIVLTPPNTTTSITLPWSVGVMLQDASTTPGTYLTPVSLGIGG